MLSVSVCLSVCCLFFRLSAVCQYVSARDGLAAPVSFCLYALAQAHVGECVLLFISACLLARLAISLTFSQLIFISLFLSVIHPFVIFSSRLSVNKHCARRLSIACILLFLRPHLHTRVLKYDIYV